MSNTTKGGIDGLSGGSVGGWLVPPEKVYIRVNDQTLDSFAPNAPRPDVVAAGMCKDPLVGISYRINGEILQNYENLGFFVERNGNWLELPGSPVNLSECRQNATALTNLLASPPFKLSGVERVGNDLVISGLLIPKNPEMVC